MTISNDGIAVSFDSYKVMALLGGVWTDLTPDVMHGSLSWGNGISGNKITDMNASSIPARFLLDNSSGKYYPDGASALSGWGDGVKIAIIVIYNGTGYCQHFGLAELDLNAGIVTNQDTVSVTVNDWFKLAADVPITLPATQLSKTFDEGATTILGLSPLAPYDNSFDTGVTTFPTIFDGVTSFTSAYAELAKLVTSEGGRMYLRFTENGEILVLENSSRRDAGVAVVQVPTATVDKWLREDGGDWDREEGGVWLRDTLNYDTLGKMTDGRINIELDYGKGVTNYATVNAYPRRVDTDPVVLASTGKALPILAGQTITLKIPYTDPSGGGTRVNAVTTSMINPQPANTQDTDLKLLTHFDASPPTDETGNHTLTKYDLLIARNFYQDGFGDTYIAREVLGPFGVFGGYSDYRVTIASSSDFDFGSGEFTIGWYEARININQERASIARGTASYPPFLLNKLNTTTNEMEVFLSSNGTSFDIANGTSFGQVKGGAWTHYELSRDADGFFYMFTDGALVAKWYSASALADGTEPLTIGLTEGTFYSYFGLDELYIYKGKCLHTKDFDPPKVERTIYEIEDCWGDTEQNRTGTDITSDISIATPTYGTEAVSLSVTNNNASDGYVYISVRGLGVYRYIVDERVIQNAASIGTKGYRNPLTLNQVYQESADAGEALLTTYVGNVVTPRTELISVTFTGNRSHYNMVAGLFVKVGDLVQISHSASGLDGYYYIQSVDKWLVGANNILEVTWYLVEDFLH